MGEQVAARFMGLQLSRLERTPDKREVGGSSPLKPIPSEVSFGMEAQKVSEVERINQVCTLKTEY